ncbi:SafA/ExsA family spore coat assembly protein [Metabacillus iocasae]|uniref:YkwD family protein/spore coat assembly protein SafA n=1 Tax=Priestia iocasae TaxID=2291674 RepID=A0ABS2QV39_9BACI|nr:SafA/ExsA family spore coat assembly protein [Metabacillus iocasae]MBM7703068.1 putative YkwD family protein/spore coat assembly protein SafA [Metabacillus iocasae]
MKTLQKCLITLSLSVPLVFGFSITHSEASTTHTVQSGDTMWKIAVKYQVGVAEIISANPSVKNANLIYPGQQLTIPQKNATRAAELKVVDLVNVERAKYNLPPLKENWELSRVARFKSQDMIDKNYFNHNSPTYGSPFDMIKNFGIQYRAAGENIAAGQQTPEDVVKAWMNSDGHRKNILSTQYKEIGVGYVKGGSYGHYWTQMFISR